MIAFRDPVLEDRAWVEQGFRASGSRGCEYSFATLFLWSRRYRQQVAALDGYVLERLQGDRGAGYLFPAGEGPLEPALSALEADAAERGEPFRLFCVTPEQLEQLEAVRPGVYSWQADRDGFDYLYDAGRLAGLSGKKLHGKRNHINAFLADHTDWRVEEITEDNLSACVAMDAAWNRLYWQREGVDASEAGQIRDEERAMARAFANYRALGLYGLLLRAEGEVVAFTMGSLIQEDTLDVHFEKAFPQVRGAYPLINREFVRWICARLPAVRWINREDDLGLEGLRRAKESYAPDQMVEKYVVTRREPVE